MTPQTEVPRGPRAALALCLILAIYAYARILEIEPAALFGVVPQLAIVALHVVPALAFALVHGALHYRVRGILVFTAISLAVGNFMENLSVATGFPFGHYEFSSLMGPKLLQVPVLLGLAYVGMAYVSWTLARLIVGNPYAPVAGIRVITLPLVASFIMIAWDLAQDPIWSTVLRGWAWRDGGPWFGVPFSNYGGWFLTVFAMYLLFAFYLRRAPTPAVPPRRAYWSLALLFYALCAMGNLLQVISQHSRTLVQDPTGYKWRVVDITSASALISIFVMGAFVVFAAARLAEEYKPITD